MKITPIKQEKKYTVWQAESDALLVDFVKCLLSKQDVITSLLEELYAQGFKPNDRFMLKEQKGIDDTNVDTAEFTLLNIASRLSQFHMVTKSESSLMNVLFEHN